MLLLGGGDAKFKKGARLFRVLLLAARFFREGLHPAGVPSARPILLS
jgi:hypothetical protein